MTVADANRRQQEWIGTYCPHPAFEDEFLDFEGGQKTGNRVCSQCGADLCEVVRSSTHGEWR